MAHFGISGLSPYLVDCRVKRLKFSHVFPLTKYSDIESVKDKYSFEILTPSDGDAL